MSAPSSSLLAQARSIRTLHRLSQKTAAPQQCPFSSTSKLFPRRAKGTNKMRGMSAIRASGDVQFKIRSIRADELPVPVANPDARASYKIDPNHGLWAFFRNRKSLTNPVDLHAHGRAWKLGDLRYKSIEDMQSLWWRCHLELNQLSTETAYRKQVKPGFGEFEIEKRETTIKSTMFAIRQALRERYTARRDAVRILEKDEDPDVFINDDGRPQWRSEPKQISEP